MAGRGAGCWESRLSGSVRGWVTTQNMGEILWHRWGNQAANREDKLHPTFWGVPSLLEKSGGVYQTGGWGRTSDDGGGQNNPS
jgi:hypothetical protein